MGHLAMHCGLFELKNGRRQSECDNATIKLREWLRLELAHNVEKVVGFPKVLKGKRDSSN